MLDFPKDVSEYDLQRPEQKVKANLTQIPQEEGGFIAQKSKISCDWVLLRKLKPCIEVVVCGQQAECDD